VVFSGVSADPGWPVILVALFDPPAGQPSLAPSRSALPATQSRPGPFMGCLGFAILVCIPGHPDAGLRQGLFRHKGHEGIHEGH
jgi:hypothetical protein